VEVRGRRKSIGPQTKEKKSRGKSGTWRAARCESCPSVSISLVIEHFLIFYLDL
jgi:hypothetical protein